MYDDMNVTYDLEHHALHSVSSLRDFALILLALPRPTASIKEEMRPTPRQSTAMSSARHAGVAAYHRNGAARFQHCRGSSRIHGACSSATSNTCLWLPLEAPARGASHPGSPERSWDVAGDWHLECRGVEATIHEDTVAVVNHAVPPVVEHDPDHGDVVVDRGVDLHPVHGEGAVAADRHHLAVGRGE